MFPAKLRSKRVWIPTVAVVAALGVGGTAWTASASADNLSGSDRDRAVAAAKKAVGPGEVTSAETSDRDDRDANDRNEAYEVEIRKADGTEVEVQLDQSFAVIGQDPDDDSQGGEGDDADDASDAPEADDRVLSDSERTSAGQAARDAVGGGTVTDASAGDDPGVAYEVDVRKADGTEWDVDLGSSFTVVHTSVDR